MPRHILFGLIFLALISLVGMSYYYDLQKRIHELVRPGPEPAPFPGNSAGCLALSALAQGETLFPFQQARQPLGSRERDIRSSELPSEEGKQIIAELISGSRERRLPALPAETGLRELFVTPEGLAVVDFTQEASSRHPGGLTMELASIYSVVNSLTQNVGKIARVQILIEGTEAETAGGTH
jgi:hypothetical protein